MRAGLTFEEAQRRLEVLDERSKYQLRDNERHERPGLDDN